MNRREFLARLVGATAVAALPFTGKSQVATIVSEPLEGYWIHDAFCYTGNRFGKTEITRKFMEAYMEKYPQAVAYQTSIQRNAKRI